MNPVKGHVPISNDKTEEYSAQAALLLRCETLYAPDHWWAETINVLWSKVFKGDLTAADAEERMLVLLRAPVLGAPNNYFIFCSLYNAFTFFIN